MRKWVYQALCAIINEGAYSNLYIKDHLDVLPEKDKALAVRIVYGTLQNERLLETIILHHCQKRPSKMIMILLMMSVYQLKFLDKVPAYAIIDEAVSLTKPKQKGFVNAILRTIAKESIDIKTYPLAIQTSLPDWLVSMWIKQYGQEKAFQFAFSTLSIHPVTVRKENQIIEYTGQDLKSDPDYLSGKISAQSLGSFEIARFLEAKAGMRVLDVCAAPGTKTLAIAQMMDDKGSIDCIDLHAHRVKLIESDAKRLHISIVHTHCQDARNLESFGSYDRVLCDVPCSGYGILARKPDMKHTLDPSDMDALIPLQQEILQEASKHVQAKGILVYSTCTMNKKENEKQIEIFLKRNDDFEWIDSKTIEPDQKQDGFYMAKLIRKI